MKIISDDDVLIRGCSVTAAGNQMLDTSALHQVG